MLRSGLLVPQAEAHPAVPQPWPLVLFLLTLQLGSFRSFLAILKGLH